MEVRKKCSEALKRQVAKSYYRGKKSTYVLAAEYGFSQSAVHRWVQLYRDEFAPDLAIKQEVAIFGSLDDNSKSKEMKKKTGELSREELIRRVSELEKNLEYETMRGAVLDKMIDIAERDLKIPIRKKSGAKQFKK